MVRMACGWMVCIYSINPRNAAAFIKLFLIRVRCVFEGGVYFKFNKSFNLLQTIETERYKNNNNKKKD